MTGRQRRSDSIFLGAAIAAALILRLDFLSASGFVIDADEGIVGLMAKHITEGREIPVFYYGQSYMGSLEPLLTAGVFLLCGATAAALKIVPLIFSLIFVVLVFELGRLLAGPAAARIAALYAAIPPVALVEWSTKARGGFIELVVIGTLALILAVRWIRDPRSPISLTVLTGVLLGLGWWVNNQIIFYILPIGLYFLLRLWRRGPVPVAGHLAAGLAAFLAGGLPFWVYNLRHDFASFGMFHPASFDDIGGQFYGLLTFSLPVIAGGRRFWQSGEVFPGSTAAAWIVIGGVLLCALWTRRIELARLLRGRVDSDQPVTILPVFFAATCLVFGFSSFGFLYEAPRYLLPLYTALAVLFGYAVCRAKSRAARGLIVCAVLAFNLASYYWGGRAIPGEPFVFEGQRVSRDHSPLIRFLDNHGIRWIQTNYWIGYRLAFETGERIKFLVFGKPTETRIEEYRREGSVLERGLLPLVLVPAQAADVERALGVMGVDYRRDDVGGYAVIYNLNPSQKNLEPVPIDPGSVTANYNAAAASAAVDGSALTRWGSAHPQVPGMELKIELPEVPELRSLGYDLGAWHHDYPRGLSITLELADGSKAEILPSSAYASVRAYLETAEEMNFFFPPMRARAVVLRQEGNHPILDWSIAELWLLR